MTYTNQTDMFAVEIAPNGDGFALRPARRSIPVPGAGEVLIKVHAAGVNGHDVRQIKMGGHPLRPGETDLPGLEVAGEIVALGEGAERWAIGDRVCALLRGGGYAEYATTAAGCCLPVPGDLGWAEAAVLPETFCTVWSNVFIDAELAEGETFLMNGGTSGIGVAAIQIASTLGHQVFATARGAEKVAICNRLGATRAIDYETEDFAEVVMAETGGRGVDVILDIVAGDYMEKDLGALAEGGRVIFIAFMRGNIVPLDVRKLMHRRLRVSGSMLRPRSVAYKQRVTSELEARIWPHIASGRISPMLDRTFPLADAADAIKVLEQRGHVGKIALTLG